MITIDNAGLVTVVMGKGTIHVATGKSTKAMHSKPDMVALVNREDVRIQHERTAMCLPAIQIRFTCEEAMNAFREVLDEIAIANGWKTQTSLDKYGPKPTIIVGKK